MKDSAMEERTSKIFAGLCMLVLVWIGVYWMWEPGEPARPRISISPEPIKITNPEPAATTPTPSPTPIQDPPSESQPIIEPVETKITTPRLIAPKFQAHTVQQDEVFQDIAQHYYGKTALWTVISKANPTIDPLKLKVGMKIRIPLDPNNIQGLVHTPDGFEPTHTQDPVVYYTIEPGDSLSRIAQKHYGSATHADFIYQSNRDTLRSKDAIRVGQTLKLPPLNPNTDP